MVAHGVEHLLGRNLLRGFHPQGHTIFGIVSHRIIQVSVHARGERTEERPYAGFAAAHRSEFERRVHVAEAEILVAAVVISHFAGERNDIRGIKTILWVVKRELRDAGLVGMRTDVTVGDTAGYPDDAFVDVPTLHDFAPLAYHLENPRLFLVHYRERFAAGGVTVRIGQLHDGGDGLPRRSSPLERDVDERTVVDAAIGVCQFRTAAIGSLSDNQLTVVHVAYRGVGVCGLRNVSEVAARIPFIDGHHGSRPVALARGIVFVQRPVELVRIGGITYHGRTVRGCSFRDDEIGTCGSGSHPYGRK